MKNRKTFIIITAFILGSVIFASCSIDKKCPAYTKADISLNSGNV